MASKHVIDPHNAGARPAKRRRVEMPVADGFIVSDTSTTTPKPKPVHKPPIPRFISAFGDSNSVNLDDKTKIDALKGQGKAMTVPKPPILFGGLAGIAGPSSKSNVPHRDKPAPRLEKVKEKKRISSAPNLALNFALNPNGTTKPTATSRLRPPPPPPAVALSTTFVPNANLRQIIPPAFPAPKPPSKPLQPIHPPVIPIPRNVTAKKELYALSTTGLGRLSDLSSENVAESLAGILLRDQHPELSVLQSDENSLLLRGLQMSPEKKGKGKYKGPVFVRGGLAARAASFFDQSSTAHILWKKDIERGPNTLPSEFCARITKILRQPKHSTRPLSYSPGIALCKIRQQNGMPHPKYKSDRLYRVIFTTPNDNKFTSQFSEGQTVSIFKPYRELCTSPDGPSPSPELPRRPTRLPPLLTPPEPSADPLTAPVHSTALVCTRFQIQP